MVAEHTTGKHNVAMDRSERSWVLYDVGNSAFVLVMVTAIMPLFFKEFAAFGMESAVSTANWGLANGTASLVLALLAPVLGAYADYRLKKRLFVVFLAAGLLFSCLILTVGKGQWLYCLLLFILARIGWAGANIFYDAFLPDVTRPERLDLISSRGYGWGYIGSVVPFLVIIVMIFRAGLEGGLPVSTVKTGFLLVVGWWALFSVPMIRNVKQRYHREGEQRPSVAEAFRGLLSTISSIRGKKKVFWFLAAYFFYIDGVGTIISMSTAYGRDLGFGVTMLIVMLLFIQVVAFPFALLYGRLASRFSTVHMLLFGISMFSLATCLAFLLPWVGPGPAKNLIFWVVAFLIASSMGGVQALSRSYYARIIPVESSAEYFGFYNIFGKFAAITGPFLMGVVGHLTGDSRWGILSILILFIVGGLLLRYQAGGVAGSTGSKSTSGDL